MNTANSGKDLRAGIIGLGQIGSGVALCLARHQRPMAVYDVRPEAAEDLEGVPAVSPSPAEVARNTDVIMIAVLNGEQIRAVLEGPEGILAAAHPGMTLVVLSTITLDELRELHALAASKDVALLDCGVTGGQVSDTGQMISMIGGETADVERVRPVLDEFNAEVHHMGGTGAGMATKIARNLIHFTLWRAGVEGARLATKAGVDLDKFIDLVEAASHSRGSSVTTWMDPDRIVAGHRMEQDLLALRKQTLGLQQKDLLAAKELAEQLEVNIASADAAWRFGEETYGLDD
jgi:3-hydroxyisobutyrate dehydrogenase-like beta-hydroxyacid dehydrogenase